MKFIATLILSLTMTGILSAQTPATGSTNPQDPNSLKWRKDKKMAKKLLKKNDNEKAVPYLVAGQAKKAKKAYFAEHLAPSYLSLRDYAAANKWYKTLMDKDSLKHKKPAYIFYYALTQKYMGQYEEAMVSFAKFRKAAGDKEADAELKKRSTHEIEGCQKGIFYRDSVPERAFKVKHLDVNINQPQADYSPMMKGSALYYSSVKGEKPFSRIFKSMKAGKDWTTGETISDNVNVANQNIGNPSFTPDGNTMYYTQCTTNEMNKMMCMIYKSNLMNGEWTVGESVGEGVNEPLSSNTQPAVGKNKDGDDVLYFVSDRNAGKGYDIYYGKINPDGSVAKPRSAGSQINTKGDEMSPYFDFKSKTLYFSSNGWVNIGGMDVYKTTWDGNGDWIEPVNMGMPVNSSTDDVGFSINELNTVGFVVSNRPGGFGSDANPTCCDDIYEVLTTKLFLAAKGTVYQDVDGTRSTATSGAVTLYDEKNGTELNSSNLNGSGTFFFDLEAKRGYKLVTKKDGFYDGVQSFNTYSNTDDDTMKYDLLLKKKTEENPLIGRTIGRIYYAYDQSTLRPDSRDTLNQVLGLMNLYPNAVVEIGAHTDGKGKEAYNLALSKKRALAVMNYYVKDKKIDTDRFVIHAYGTAEPAASNTKPDGKDNPEGRALNRRTEFKVIKELAPGWKDAKKMPTPPAPPIAAPMKSVPAPKALAPAPKIAAPKPSPAAPKLIKKDAPPAKGSSSAAPAAPTQTPAALPAAAPAAAATKMPKEDMAPAAPKVEVKKGASKPAKPAAPAGYKGAPAQNTTLSGHVYIEKDGQRVLVTQGAVFLTTNEGGFQQQVQYVKEDGAYSFDISRANADTFKLIARKYKDESSEVVFSLADIRASNKPVDLVIKAK